MSSSPPLPDAAGRRRPLLARVPGQPRATKARYPADPPTVDEIVALMRQAEDDRHRHRLDALTIVLWRAGLRIQEALSLTEAISISVAARFGQTRKQRAPARGRHERLDMLGDRAMAG